MGFRSPFAIAPTPHDRAKKWKKRNLDETVTVIKAAPGRLHNLVIENTQGAIAWVQVFDAAVAGDVTLGTTEPDFEFQVPATTGAARLSFPGDAHLPFETGIAIASTTADKGAAGSADGVLAYATYI